MKLDKQYKTLFALVAFGVILFLGLSHLDLLIGGFRYIISVVYPFLIGAAMAFVVNVPMRFFENRVFSKVKRGKRALSLVLAILCIIGILAFVCVLVLPELATTLYGLAQMIPESVRKTQDVLNQYLQEGGMAHRYIGQVDFDWNQISKQLMSFFQDSATNVLNSTVTFVSSVVQTVVTFVLGLVFAINLLLQKEKITLQVKKICFSYIKKDYAKQIVRIARLANGAFSGFISGQCTEAVILGAIIFAVMTIFKIPYALLIAVLIGVLSLIPIAGGFIASSIGFLLILMVNPIKACVFVLIFVVVQQFEGNLIYPHVVGNSVGLPSIWVLVAVTVGGNIAGVVGMLVSIPTCSVLYVLLKESVNKRLKIKRITKEEIQGN